MNRFHLSTYDENHRLVSVRSYTDQAQAIADLAEKVFDQCAANNVIRADYIARCQCAGPDVFLPYPNEHRLDFKVEPCHSPSCAACLNTFGIEGIKPALSNAI